MYPANSGCCEHFQWCDTLGMEKKELAIQRKRDIRRRNLFSYRRRQWHPTPVLLPGKSMDRGAWWAAVHGVTKSWEWLSDFTSTFHSCIGEGNGNPLQCSCLENPRDGGAWWAAVSGVAQSPTRLKRLSSSSSRSSGRSYQRLEGSQVWRLQKCDSVILLPVSGLGRWGVLFFFFFFQFLV